MIKSKLCFDFFFFFFLLNGCSKLKKTFKKYNYCFNFFVSMMSFLFFLKKNKNKPYAVFFTLSHETKKILAVLNLMPSVFLIKKFISFSLK